jgi:serine/threonine protein kinase/tetratricopeptide (TPR) repeat protein
MGAPLSPGQRLERYELVSFVAEGGMGQVWLGRFEGKHGFRKLVAVKTVRGDRATDGEALRMFLDEARLLARLEHPNVGQVLDVGDAAGMPYIVMEWIDGATLEEIVESGGALPVALALRIVADVCAGLHAAHELRGDDGRLLGVVHRDVSPHNVMVTRQGVAKLLDFGIAKAQGRQSDETAPGVARGKMLFMAPEQAAAESVDRRADVWAMGAVFVGLLPGDGGPAKGGLLARMALRKTIDLPDSVPEPVKAAVRRALALDPEERFQTAAAMRYELEHAMASSGMLASAADVAAHLERAGLLPPPRAVSEPSAPSSEPPTTRRASPVPTAANRVVGPTSRTLVAHQSLLPPRKTSGRRWFAAVLAALALAATAYAIVLVARPDGKAATSPTAGTAQTAAPPPTVVAVTDLVTPESSNREAHAAYRSALQAFRDGQFTRFVVELRRTLGLDEGFAPAHVRLARTLMFASSGEAREHYAAAMGARGSLSEHDRALLDAFEPYVQRDPADAEETRRRLKAASDHYPNDAELAYYAAVALAPLPELGDAAGELGRVVELDASFGMAYAAKAEILAYAGRTDEALATLNACLQRVPSSTQCLRIRAAVEEDSGRCAEVMEDLRQIGVVDPGDGLSRRAMADAALAMGQNLDTVSELLSQSRATMRPQEAEASRVADEYAIAALGGDFETAERAARDEQRAGAGDPSRTAHAIPARRLVDVLREEGRDADAAAVAGDFLRRSGAWAPDPRGEDFAVSHDVTPLMLGIVRRAGRISQSELETRREAWVHQWPTRPTVAPYLWAHGWAAPAETPDEGAAAVASLARFGRAPAYTPLTMLPADIGRAFFLAGRRDAETVGWLKRGVAVCRGTDYPFAVTRARLWLGRALEETGDKGGACGAYAAVSARWGRARPRSVSAEEARARSAGLHCTSAGN